MAELIRKQPAPTRVRLRQPVGAHGLAGGAHPEPPPRGRARLVGVVAGAVVLLGWIAGAAILAGNRPAGPVEPRVEPPASITGSFALRPDVLSGRLGGEGPDRAVARPHQPPPAADESPVMVPTPHLVVGPQPQVDVVRRFFELLPANPAEASRLLSPDLLGGDGGDFVESWGVVQAITLEATRLRPDGTVLAVVSLQERTGRWMHVEQVFHLTDTSVPRIVGTEVLAAQRQ
ncbi:hypothetical protein ACFXGA_01490 [Actinosynnema sp. NPDC059335]|uniref:hypothetical protein n=1 Tax=Actinosynnema sp. NPDC059335 TaxID=3346804 RepID=UPI00366F76FF